jgi:hypothetical protein
MTQDPISFMRIHKLAGCALLCLLIVLPNQAAHNSIASAQEPSPCEPQKMAFNVSVERSAPTPVIPTGKALVYVTFDIVAGNEANLAADGELVGGARNHTYFYFFLNPGEHHLCGWTRVKWVGVCRLRLSVAAGETYYLELNIQGNRGGAKTSMRLQPLDPDQGIEMLRHLKYSHSVARK